MTEQRRPRFWLLAGLCVLAVALCAAVPASASPAPELGAGSNVRQAAFAAAAREFGVPERVLLAVSYNLTRWEDHGGAPSFAGGYGPMHLTHLDSAPTMGGKGDDAARAVRDTRAIASLHTLDAAAALLGASPELLRTDPAQNIRGGAALLAEYARSTSGALPASEPDWYSAVMRYSQASDTRTAARFADAVYATIQRGAARVADGQAIMLAAASIAPSRPAAVQALVASSAPCIEAPASGVT